MTSIGLDIGTGFVKCVSDTARIKFPSLYAYRYPASWEDKKGIIEATGYDAVKLSEYADAILIRPVMLGRPVNEAGFAELAKKAIELVLQNKDAMTPNELARSCIAVGLPYDARKYRDDIKRMVTKLFGAKNCYVVPQVLGTLVEACLSDAVVISIGHGTTEIVVFRNDVPIKGISIHNAVTDICSKLRNDKTSYLDGTLFEDNKAKPFVRMLVDGIVDDLNAVRKDICKTPLVVSGGGIMIPGIKEAMISRLGKDIIIPQDPVMSNAAGLFQLASRAC
ncbi:MAG: hypothetical protein KGI27_12755 [Thaumarchaeota archaeon]|nr:hypothetical protein [Nitrososphaerota archaeon]